MRNKDASMSAGGRATMIIVSAISLFALVANARDIAKYFRLKAMSLGAPKH